MNDRFDFQIVEAGRLTSAVRAEVLGLCNSAYGEDVSHLFAAYTADVHVLARMGRVLVGHGMIVTRWLQAGAGPLLRTAYIELVATAEACRNQGIGARMVRELAGYAAANPYDLAALCPADTGLYGHLGWQYWRGPLFIRPRVSPGQKETPALIPTPEERVMILRLPSTPPLDLNQPLSAEWRGGGELW
ncbi:MAG: GNAT family N-acetyltransferase [Chloroflexota bacterium]|nr:GNAT family N-acetyltransferase [Chloroflexota bacterium]